MARVPRERARAHRLPVGLAEAQIIRIVTEAPTADEAAARLGMDVGEFYELLRSAPLRKALRETTSAIADYVAAVVGPQARRCLEVLATIAENPEAHEGSRVGAAARVLEAQERWVEREDLRRNLEQLAERLAALEAPPKGG